MSSTPPRGTPWIRLTWLWRPSVRRYNRARVSLCTLRKQPFQQTRVRWGDFPLITNLINYIKFTSRNREACLRCPEVFGPPDKHNNISVKPSHNQEEEETEDSFRNMERQNVVSAGKTGIGLQDHPNIRSIKAWSKIKPLKLIFA